MEITDFLRKRIKYNAAARKAQTGMLRREEPNADLGSPRLLDVLFGAEGSFAANVQVVLFLLIAFELGL